MSVLAKLPLPGQDEDYWATMIGIAETRKFDGCTGVPDFYLLACIEHDFHYRGHKTFYGDPITQSDADKRFRLVVQSLSVFGVLSPMSWWRWAALRLIGSFAWNSKSS